MLRDKNGKRQLVTKGAVEEILSICSFIEIEGEVKPITQELIDGAQKIATENNLEGIRVIAVAQKNSIHDTEAFGVEDESDMVLIGFKVTIDRCKTLVFLKLLDKINTNNTKILFRCDY